MASGFVSATDRFKALLANALERVCVLEAELEQARARISELEAEASISDLEAIGLDRDAVR
jgi:hypothetical protein